MTEQSQYKAPALEKGLDILELLAEQTVGLNQKEIAQALGRSVNEIFRMLVCLKSRGYITQAEGSDRFELSLKMFELSHQHSPIKRLVSKSVPIMERLAYEVDQSCHLVVQHNQNLVVVAQVDGPGSISFSVRLGSRLNFDDTAAGRVIMAYLSKDELEKLGSSELIELTPDLLEELEEIKNNAFCEEPSRHVKGVWDLSAPVLDHSGKIVAALSIPFVNKLQENNREAKAQAKKALFESTQSISEQLGISH